MRYIAILLAALLALQWSTPSVGADSPPGFTALVKDLDRQASAHGDKCAVKVEDQKGDLYVVSAECKKTKYRCYFAVDGTDLDMTTGLPATEMLGCKLKQKTTTF